MLSAPFDPAGFNLFLPFVKLQSALIINTHEMSRLRFTENCMEENRLIKKGSKIHVSTDEMEVTFQPAGGGTLGFRSGAGVSLGSGLPQALSYPLLSSRLCSYLGELLWLKKERYV